jgi:hypothetical protein
MKDERHHQWAEWIDQDKGIWGPTFAALAFTLWMLALLALSQGPG